MKWGNLSGLFFIIHPSTLLPAADLAAFAKECFSAKRTVEKLQAITTEGEIIDVLTAAGSSAPTARDMPAQGNALGIGVRPQMLKGGIEL